MTDDQVKSLYDERKRQSHRLMKININNKYQNIDGDIRCAGTYINDAKGSRKDPNVIFENDLESEEMESYIPIKTLREIKNGEELLIDYGDLFFTYSDAPIQMNQISNQVISIIFIFQQIENEIDQNQEMKQSKKIESKVVNSQTTQSIPKLVAVPKQPNISNLAFSESNTPTPSSVFTKPTQANSSQTSSTMKIDDRIETSAPNEETKSKKRKVSNYESNDISTSNLKVIGSVQPKNQLFSKTVEKSKEKKQKKETKEISTNSTPATQKKIETEDEKKVNNIVINLDE